MLQEKQNTSELNEGDVICIKFKDMSEYVGIYSLPNNPDFVKTIVNLSNPYIVHIVSDNTSKKGDVVVRNKIELEPFFKSISNDQAFSFDKMSANILSIFKVSSEFEAKYRKIVGK